MKGHNPFPEVGQDYLIFKNLLPKDQKVSFITDRPFNHYDPDVQKFYSAQSALAPVILTGPGELAAIIDCSNSKIADKRMQEEGYNLLRPLADGKALAVKKQ